MKKPQRLPDFLIPHISDYSQDRLVKKRGKILIVKKIGPIPKENETDLQLGESILAQLIASVFYAEYSYPQVMNQDV